MEIDLEESNGKKPKIQPRDPRDPEAKILINGLYYATHEKEAVIQQLEEERLERIRRRKERWAQTTGGRLCLEFYAKFMEYKKYLEENPQARWGPDGSSGDYPEYKLFEDGLRLIGEHQRERSERDRKNLEKAKLAERCEMTRMDGERCRSPRVRGTKLCYMHTRLEEAKAVRLDLVTMEDADSIQVAIKKLQAAVIDGTLDHKQVSQLAYLIQLAAWNVTRTTLGTREVGASDDGEI
jgi:hypothetical protein